MFATVLSNWLEIKQLSQKNYPVHLFFYSCLNLFFLFICLSNGCQRRSHLRTWMVQGPPLPIQVLPYPLPNSPSFFLIFLSLLNCRAHPPQAQQLFTLSTLVKPFFNLDRKPMCTSSTFLKCELNVLFSLQSALTVYTVHCVILSTELPCTNFQVLFLCVKLLQIK